MVALFRPTQTVARVSIESKKRSWCDGFAAAVRDEEFQVQHAADEASYKAGWDAGEAWRERHGLEPLYAA